MDLTVNVKLYPEGCEEGTVKEMLFSGDRLAVLVEHTGPDTLSVFGSRIDDQEDLHRFFLTMADLTRGE